MSDVITKLEQLAQYIEATNDKTIPSKLDDALDYISGYDYFGTEGQNDPRGDQRDAEWVPYDPEYEDSDGEYEYFRVETTQNAVKCIKELIEMIKKSPTSDRASKDVYDMVEEAFSSLFKEYGLN